MEIASLLTAWLLIVVVIYTLEDTIEMDSNLRPQSSLRNISRRPRTFKGKGQPQMETKKRSHQINLYYRITSDRKGHLSCEVNLHLPDRLEGNYEINKHINDSSHVIGNIYLICTQVSSSICYYDCTASCLLSEEGCKVPGSVTNVIENCMYTRRSAHQVVVEYTIIMEALDRTGNWSCEYQGVQARPILLQAAERKPQKQREPLEITISTPLAATVQLIRSDTVSSTHLEENKIVDIDIKVNTSRKGNTENPRINLWKYDSLTKPEFTLLLLVLVFVAIVLNMVLSIRCVLTKSYMNSVARGRPSECLENCLCFRFPDKFCASLTFGSTISEYPKEETFLTRRLGETPSLIKYGNGIDSGVYAQRAFSVSVSGQQDGMFYAPLSAVYAAVDSPYNQKMAGNTKSAPDNLIFDSKGTPFLQVAVPMSDILPKRNQPNVCTLSPIVGRVQEARPLAAPSYVRNGRGQKIASLDKLWKTFKIASTPENRYVSQGRRTRRSTRLKSYGNIGSKMQGNKHPLHNQKTCQSSTISSTIYEDLSGSSSHAVTPMLVSIHGGQTGVILCKRTLSKTEDESDARSNDYLSPVECDLFREYYDDINPAPSVRDTTSMESDDYEENIHFNSIFKSSQLSPLKAAHSVSDLRENIQLNVSDSIFNYPTVSRSKNAPKKASFEEKDSEILISKFVSLSDGSRESRDTAMNSPGSYRMQQPKNSYVMFSEKL